jgi:hypothetical protein
MLTTSFHSSSVCPALPGRSQVLHENTWTNGPRRVGSASQPTPFKVVHRKPRSIAQWMQASPFQDNGAIRCPILFLKL